VCVPLSRLAESVAAAQKDVAESGLVCCILGHIGDGNFHCSPLVMMDDPDEIARAHAFAERVVLRALTAIGGTCTGEHGIGQMSLIKHALARSTKHHEARQGASARATKRYGKLSN
jgi:D-lactate dehydrogenase (cytochrome)